MDDSARKCACKKTENYTGDTSSAIVYYLFLEELISNLLLDFIQTSKVTATTLETKYQLFANFSLVRVKNRVKNNHFPARFILAEEKEVSMQSHGML